jgi:hypothetical protein
MGGKLPEAIWFMVFQDGRAIGNPDALVIEIHFTGLTVTRNFLWASAGEERAMEHA